MEDMVEFLKLHPTWVWIEINTFKNGVGMHKACTLVEQVTHTVEIFQRRIENGDYVRDQVTGEIRLDNIDAWTVKCIDEK